MTDNSESIRRTMKVSVIFGLMQIFTVYSAIMPPPWADPSRNKCATQPGGWLLLYWPQDGKCYRIFQRGSPCPATMELSPAHDSEEQIVGECKCPPRTARSSDSDVCHPIYSKGPCERGYYFAPLAVTNSERFGHCLKVEQCRHNEIFWPHTNECFPKYSRGPCSEGQLIILNKETLIAECQCSKNGALGKYYWPPTKSCHQFYTRGPCLEKGSLFLPGPTCGCHQFLPNYDPETKRCYEIGGTGPCKFGQRFVVDAMTMKASCSCKPEHIPWEDGQCYRLYTRGPCGPNQILLNNSTCRDIPCPRGKLYFPEYDSCHRVGVKGPCGRGQLVLFEQSIKPSIEGISYRGICGCTEDSKCSSTEDINEEVINGRNIQHGPEELAMGATNVTKEINAVTICEKNENPEQHSCHLLYTEGPCSSGEWLVPVRQGRGDKQLHRFGNLGSDPTLFHTGKYQTKVRCDCKPGYTKDKNNGTCRIPLITLAQFLNGKDLFR